MELYLHIPFCRKKCRYCDFASFPGKEAFIDRYLEMLLLEAEQRSFSQTGPFRTVYLGGGTPSLLSPEQLKFLIRGLRDRLEFAPEAEFTAEANPGTLTPAWLDTAREGGVNRISVGMQAAQDDLLGVLGRIHRFQDVRDSVRLIRAAGFENLSLDLMFGLPGQTPAAWEETLEAALFLGPDHISAYGLIPEAGTPLAEDLSSGLLRLPEPETERDMYEMLKNKLRSRSFQQYEISNFALPGRECRHNIGYWTQVPYLGLGLSAASMLSLQRDEDGMRCVRSVNPRSFDDYQALILEHRTALRETEEITPRETAFETMMLGLRMTRGVSEKDFYEMHRVTLAQRYGEKLCRLQEQGLLLHRDGRVFLTDRGMDLQNTVLVALMD